MLRLVRDEEVTYLSLGSGFLAKLEAEAMAQVHGGEVLEIAGGEVLYYNPAISNAATPALALDIYTHLRATALEAKRWQS